MANFPFKDAESTSYAEDLHYPLINYDGIYYTKFDGKIMAIKPLAFGIFKNKNDSGSSWDKFLLVQAANGKSYRLNMCFARIFLTAQDAINYDRCVDPQYTSPFKEMKLDDIFVRNGLKRRSRQLNGYVWSESRGEALHLTISYMFWTDKDGEHLKLPKQTADGKKIYLSKEECVNDNFQVLEFTDTIKVPKGEYTLKREFTIEADSEEEAEELLDKKLKNI